MRPEPQTSNEPADLALNAATEKADRALDTLLAAPSRSSSDFVGKLRALKAEYGYEWQERHIKCLIADLAIFAS